MKLQDKKWKWFFIKKLFDIQKGERLTKENRIKGEIPLITATSINNGVGNKISYGNFKGDKKIFKSKITIDMFYNSFYHSYEYFSDDNVHTLIAKNKTNQYIDLFICSIFKREQFKYAYGRQVRLHRLEREKIKLPVGKNNNPDWEFMEDYIKYIINNKSNFQVQKAWNDINYFKKSYHQKKISLQDRKWKWFLYSELFKISRGQRLIEEDRIKGVVPYFSASELNNGLTDSISNPLFIEKDALIYSTFGDCFYVAGNFTASDEISIFKSKYLNSFNGLFISTTISKNKYKYNFGRKAFKNKYCNDKIKLPIDSQNNPDWKFMEDYIKSLPYSASL